MTDARRFSKRPVYPHKEKIDTNSIDRVPEVERMFKALIKSDKIDRIRLNPLIFGSFSSAFQLSWRRIRIINGHPK